MRISEFQTVLVERFLNLHTAHAMQPWKNQVWDALQRSYAAAGGFKSAANIDELINDSSLWKIVTRNGKLSAIVIYKDKYGRKSMAVGTDGTDQGKRDLFKIKQEDTQHRRAWAEVSGAPERLMARLGSQPVPNRYAQVLTGKEIMSYNDDGYHYTRLIAGVPYEKIIFGFPALTPELDQALRALDIEPHFFASKTRD
jgi:hypothetical protein